MAMKLNLISHQPSDWSEVTQARNDGVRISACHEMSSEPRAFVGLTMLMACTSSQLPVVAPKRSIRGRKT